MLEVYLKFIFKIRNLHLALLASILSIGTLGYAEDGPHGTGLIPYQQDEWFRLEERTPKIIGVRPNKIGAARIHEHRKANNLPPQNITVASFNEDEFITSMHWSPEDLKNVRAAVGPVSLPSSVDNSKLACFPPVGDQGRQGSCVAWATTYYGGTHELGLANGYNNKTSFTNVLSPKWTYNMTNWGNDAGTFIEYGYGLLAQNGATSLTRFPYDTNYREWDLNQQDWINAISNRMKPFQMVPGFSQPQDLTVIKGLLNNGHILSIGTFILSWVFTNIKADPANPSNPYLGQLACTYMNGRNGGHNISIVGYDDNLWIDVNGNGVVDQGERGAFLICNSWGPNWGNKGFVWVSYDAFLPTSAVANGPTAGRVALCRDWGNAAFSQVAKTTNYRPSLIGTFTISQTIRNQIAIQGGIGPTNATSPTSFFNSMAFSNSGGPYAFNGTTTTTPMFGSFALDFTDLIPPATGSANPQKYMLELADTAAGNPTQLTSFALIDNVHNVNVANNQTITADNAKVYASIIYDFYNQKVPDKTPPQVSITSPSNNAVVQGTIQVIANATDNVGISRVEFYLNGKFVVSDNTAPYMYLFDTTTVANGVHTVTAIAYDTSNNTATSTINVNVQNVKVLPTSYYINCGGPTVNSGGITWVNDSPYINGAGTATFTNNSIPFSNPLYNTERFGKKIIYNFPVQNGRYNVVLKFAEIYWHQAGMRRFNLKINGIPLINNLDLFAKVGFGKPYDESFFLTVTNSNLNIELDTLADNAKINGILINKQY